MKFFNWIPFALSASVLSAADNDCAPEPPVECCADVCCRMHCFGPSQYGVNAPVNPVSCQCDVVVTVAGLCWNARQDGLEYAINTEATNGDQERPFLVNAQYESPQFKWNFGFKLGLGQNLPCDGWDFGLIWTHFNGKASSKNEAEQGGNFTLLTLWSGDKINVNNPGTALFAYEIKTHWEARLNLVDFSLGRKYWNSHRVALRPEIGVRLAFLKQKFGIDHVGGVHTSPIITDGSDEVALKNSFKGVGIRAGLDGEWNIGCGFALYGNFAASLLDGRFAVDHNEKSTQTVAPFDKQNVLDTENHFRATRMVTDCGLGLQYSTLFCACNYRFTIALGWEQHLFLDMNQFWRVVPGQGSSADEDYNIYHQCRGDFSTQGVTLTIVFDF